MISIYERGDIIELADQGRFDILVHGCNCFHRMRAGVAKQVSNRWPGAARVDIKETSFADRAKLGTFTVHKAETRTRRPILILNLYTQFDYGYDGKVYVDYDAVSRGFKLINQTWRGVRIGIPLIGCGLAGGDWGEVWPRIMWEQHVANRLIVVDYQDPTHQ
jgi:O-acetyl-ADP-ribose deacetylase (regulator of RNase III)